MRNDTYTDGTDQTSPECERCGDQIKGERHSHGVDYYHPGCDPAPEKRVEDCPEFLKDQ